MRLWLLTNGYGEDRAAALVAAELAARRSGLDLRGAPLLTPGSEFIARGIRVATAGMPPPSGGFPTTSVRTALRDAPFARACCAYVRRLRSLKRSGDVFVAAGDVFLTGLGRIAFGRPGVHVALAKSIYGQRHSALEHVLLRRWTHLVFARDQATADRLQARGVHAVFDGNVLVDCLPAAAARPEEPGATASSARAPRVLLLPGSRLEAPANLVRLLDVVTRVQHPAVWMCAWSGAVALKKGVRAAADAGWDVVGNELVGARRTVTLLAGCFESLVAGCDLVIGLAGTANEQAAALGKPIVTFAGCGPQTTARRMAEQDRLLGGAAQFVRGPASDVAVVVTRLLQSPEERQRRGTLGVARLGPPGAASRIADRLIEECRL